MSNQERIFIISMVGLGGITLYVGIIAIAWIVGLL